MSKCYGNTVPLFAPAGRQAKLIRRVVTDSRRPRTPRTRTRARSSRCSRVRRPGGRPGRRDRYRTGGIGYGDVKALLARQLDVALAPMRDRHTALLADPARLDAALEAGERHAVRRAAGTLRAMVAAMGL